MKSPLGCRFVIKKNSYQLLLFIVLIANYIILNIFNEEFAYKYHLRVCALIILIIGLISNMSLYKVDILWLALIFLGLLFSIPENLIPVNLVFILLFLIATRKANLPDIYHYAWLSISFGVVLVLLLLYLGVIENSFIVINNRLRYTFGLNSPNTFSQMIYAWALLTFYGINKNQNYMYFICILVIGIVYTFSDSNSSVLAVIIYFLNLYILKHSSNRLFVKIISIFSVLGPFVITLLSFYLLNIYPQLDVMLSLRLSFNAALMSNMTLINYMIGGGKYLFVDNSYLVIIYSVGFPFLIFMIYLIIKSVLYYAESNDAKTYSFIISFIYYSFAESSLVRPEILVSLFFWILIFRPYFKRMEVNDLIINQNLQIIKSDNNYSNICN